MLSDFDAARGGHDIRLRVQSGLDRVGGALWAAVTWASKAVDRQRMTECTTVRQQPGSSGRKRHIHAPQPGGFGAARYAVKPIASTDKHRLGYR